MPEITIKEEICKKCGLCVENCGAKVFHQETRDVVPEVANLKYCINCGHCASLCPVGAITHSDYPNEKITAINVENLPSYDQLMELLYSRRSRRRFTDVPVEKKVIEKLLEAARFAPSGHNEQTTEFIVVKDKAILKKISIQSTKDLVKMLKPFRSKIGRCIMSLILNRRSVEYVSSLASEMEGFLPLVMSGKDLVLHDAPCLILFCADSSGGEMRGINANLALQNATLAAETIGLGCFYTGFVTAAAGRFNNIGKLVDLPQTHKIYGGLAIGYPKITFKKWPERKAAIVSWI